MSAPAQNIAHQNKAFEAMRPRQKRIAIARDVLDLLDTSEPQRRIRIDTGHYFVLHYEAQYSVRVGDSLQSVLLNPRSSCSVCAKGAIFASKVLKYNVYNVELTDFCTSGSIVFDDGKMTEHLKGIFSSRQLDLIENAFEQKLQNESTGSGVSKSKRAAAMYYNEESPEYRLRLIMENIIENNGEFVVPTSMSPGALNFMIDEFGF